MTDYDRCAQKRPKDTKFQFEKYFYDYSGEIRGYLFMDIYITNIMLQNY